MTKKNQLVPMQAGIVPALYQQMQIAIRECHSIDECKSMAVEAGAIAAYYQQIKDEESVRKFLEIKIRAWRRIGEILLTAKVDEADCNTLPMSIGTKPAGSFNMAEYVRRIRTAFKDNKDIELLNDGAIRQALKVAKLPADFFEQNAGEYSSIDNLCYAYARLEREEWEATPEGQAHLKEVAVRQKQWAKEDKKRQEEQAANAAANAERTRQDQLEIDEIKKLKAARDAALAEVGFTMDRRDRTEIHQVVLLLKKSIHDILRRAAFDRHLTMQAILRSGLMMWLMANGYAVPSDDMLTRPIRRDDAGKFAGKQPTPEEQHP
jgi:hypothetical protein